MQQGVEVAVCVADMDLPGIEMGNDRVPKSVPKFDPSTPLWIDKVAVQDVIVALSCIDLPGVREPQKLHVMNVLFWVLNIDHKTGGEAGLLMKVLSDLKTGRTPSKYDAILARCAAGSADIGPQFDELVGAETKRIRSRRTVEVYRENEKRCASRAEAIAETAKQRNIETESVIKAIRRERQKTDKRRG